MQTSSRFVFIVFFCTVYPLHQGAWYCRSLKQMGEKVIMIMVMIVPKPVLDKNTILMNVEIYKTYVTVIYNFCFLFLRQKWHNVKIFT